MHRGLGGLPESYYIYLIFSYLPEHLVAVGVVTPASQRNTYCLLNTVQLTWEIGHRRGCEVVQDSDELLARLLNKGNRAMGW